ncbi:hypothetical protein FJU08_01415 [Martelella alba]|uniref:Uncharacterized protein n=1 Tax=Martelella alba TaxID=2590451 RepID=A0A506UIW5_9HYPH|nr:hypothetical protein [Martelella alba]TPW33250.1 hypothetical protein FJU08_01415 [Martelella alba]
MTTSLGKLRATSLSGGTPGAGLLALSPWRRCNAGSEWWLDDEYLAEMTDGNSYSPLLIANHNTARYALYETDAEFREYRIEINGKMTAPVLLADHNNDIYAI